MGGSKSWAMCAGLAAALLALPVVGVVSGPAAAASVPVASVGDVRLWEGDSSTRTAQVPVTLSTSSTADVFVSFSLTAGTATAGVSKNASTTADFKDRTGILKFPAGAVVKYVAVAVFGDTRLEPDESVNVGISSPSGAALGDSSGAVTIADDDSSATAGAVVSMGDASIHEGDSKVRVARLSMTLSRPATASVTVTYRLVPGTATGAWTGSGIPPVGTDFADRGGAVQTMVFKANLAGITPVNKAVAVKVAPDISGEGDETFSVEILGVSGPAALGDDTGAGTVIDDDVPPIVTLSVGLAGAGAGSVSSSPPGISCGATCSAPFVGGSSVTLSATPDESSTFTGWSGACTGSGPCVLAMNGNRSVTATFAVIPPPTVWTQVAAGRNHSCGLTAGGAYCWGFGFDGELGNGTNVVSVSAPVAVSSLGSGVQQIAAGDYHSCALTSAGGVWCWGMGGSGQLGNGLGTDSNVPVAVSGLGSGVTQISAGTSSSCAVTTAGAVFCWGIAWANGTTSDSNVPVAVSGLGSGVAQVSAGEKNSCAVTTAGAAMCWGLNLAGELGDGTFTSSVAPVSVSGLGSGVAQVSTSFVHSCAVTTAGAVWCWGDNTSGELGDGTTTSSAVPVAVSGLGSGVLQASTGGFTDGSDFFVSSCGVATSGTALCWGSNSVGQLGDGGGEASSAVPAAVLAQGSGSAQISVGRDHACAVTTGGTAYCWGSSSWGMLGDGGVGGGGSTPVVVIGP